MAALGQNSFRVVEYYTVSLWLLFYQKLEKIRGNIFVRFKSSGIIVAISEFDDQRIYDRF